MHPGQYGDGMITRLDNDKVISFTTYQNVRIIRPLSNEEIELKAKEVNFKKMMEMKDGMEKV